MRHFEVWVTLEEWDDNDNKIRDVENCLIGKVQDEDSGRQVFMTVQDLGLCVKYHLSPMIKFKE